MNREKARLSKIPAIFKKITRILRIRFTCRFPITKFKKESITV